MNETMRVTKRSGALAVALAMTLSACGGPLPEDAENDAIASEGAALKNGVPYNGGLIWRGTLKVEIFFERGQSWSTCSGQVVGKRAILTAAHCLTQVIADNGGYARVRVWRPTASGWLPVLPDVLSVFRINPKYNTDMSAKYDVGLILAPTLQPLQNVTEDDAALLSKSTPSGMAMTALGFGYYTDTAYGEARSGVVTPTYNANAGALDYSFFSGTTQPWVCRGDSGGPLKTTTFQYGVASLGTGPGSGPCRSQAHWAATANNIPWIKSTIEMTGMECFDSSTMLSCW